MLWSKFILEESTAQLPFKNGTTGGSLDVFVRESTAQIPKYVFPMVQPFSSTFSILVVSLTAVISLVTSMTSILTARE